MFQNFLNATHRFTARGILDNNFEISLRVFLAKTTTSHTITYTIIIIRIVMIIIIITIGMF